MSPRAARARMRIGELARAAGVSRATIQHYVSAGLLPKPRKTARTMAYYDAGCVARVRAIKELQARYLPLSVIRKVLGPPATRSSRRARDVLAQAGADLAAVLEQAERSMEREEVLAELGMHPDGLAGLERIGLVTARREGDRERFGPHDVAILRAVARLNHAGLDREAGFHAEDLLIYRDAIAALMAREVELFARHALDRSHDDVARIATAAALGATELIAALHRKLVAEMLASVTSPQPPDR